MDIFAANLKNRATELGLSNAEVARRAGLTERRYAHYVSGDREPDLTTLVRIARVLQSSPNVLLRFDDADSPGDVRRTLLDRLLGAVDVLSDEEVEVITVQAEAVAALRSSRR